MKIDAQLCSFIKSTIHTLLYIFLSHEIFALVWSETHAFYINIWCVPRSLDISCSWRFDGLMFAYLGQLLVALYDFNELLPSYKNLKKEHDNRNTFFVTLGLYAHAFYINDVMPLHSLENKHKDTFFIYRKIFPLYHKIIILDAFT